MTDLDLHLSTRPVGHVGSRRTRSSGRVALVAAISVVLLAATLASWIVTIPGNAGRIDFAPQYASALLVREGHADAMYDPSAQSDVIRAATGGAAATTAPTALTPTAVLVDVPLTFLPLWLASLVWSSLQVLLLVAAAVIASRAAPWPEKITRHARVLVAVAAIAGGGTLMLLPLNQWDGVAAAGLALAYADLRGGRDGRAMVWLTILVLAGKPHLAIGLALFLIARRPRSIVPGAIAASVVCGLTLVLVPLAAVGQWVATVAHVNGGWPASATIGVFGIAAAVFGGTPASTALGYAVAVAALLACVVLGRWAAPGRRERRQGRAPSQSTIDPLFLGVTLLSLLAAPHVFPYDLVVLIPGFVGCVAWAAAHDTAADWPGRWALSALGAWFTVALVCLLMLSPPGSYRPTPLLPVLLLASALACVMAARSGLPTREEPVAAR